MSIINMRTLFTLMLICFFSRITMADKPTAVKMPEIKYVAEDIYKAYEKYTPQDMVKYVKKGIAHFLKVGKKQALSDFDVTYPSKWNNFPKGYQFMVISCKEGRAVSHTLSDYFPVFKQPGFAKQFKDINGKKTYINLCEGVKKHKSGFWILQKQYWPETKGPLTMGAFLVPIPGTSYYGHIFYPTRKYTEDQLNKVSFK